MRSTSFGSGPRCDNHGHYLENRTSGTSSHISLHDGFARALRGIGGVVCRRRSHASEVRPGPGLWRTLAIISHTAKPRRRPGMPSEFAAGVPSRRRTHAREKNGRSALANGRQHRLAASTNRPYWHTKGGSGFAFRGRLGPPGKKGADFRRPIFRKALEFRTIGHQPRQPAATSHEAGTSAAGHRPNIP